MNLELKKAIDQISKDKGLDRDMLVDTLEDAVRTSVIRKYGENIDVEVSYNDDTGEIQVHQFKIVVDDVADPDTEIDIEKAREAYFTTDAAGERAGIGFTIMEAFMDELRVENNAAGGLSVFMDKKLA